MRPNEVDVFLRRMPEKDSEYLTPATRLLEKRREMIEVEDALSTTKDVRTSLNHCTLTRSTGK